MLTDEKQYLDCLNYVLENGQSKGDRTGTGTISTFRPPTMRFKLNDGETFPLLTTKKVRYKTILKELLWFLSGSTNINDLDSKIWDEWAADDGSIGPMYGELFRDLYISIGGVKDPIGDLINDIKDDPNSRRLVMTTWRPDDLPLSHLSPQENVRIGNMALAPCHGTVIQFYVNAGKLSMSTYQRSADMMLGLPFNIASYATLLLMVASLTGLYADELIYDLGDAHIYKDHIDGAKEQLNRGIRDTLPSLEIDKNIDDIGNFTLDSVKLVNYTHQQEIKLKVSV